MWTVVAGIAGHAGMFSTVRDVASFLSAYLTAAVDPEYRFFINATTIATFTGINNVSQSSRAVGWDTNSDLVTTYGYNKSCGTMGVQAFMHIGYTGTCVCVDKQNRVWSVVLTNRYI